MTMLVPTIETQQLSVERAAAILAECRTTDQAKGIRDQANAIATYLRATKASLEAQYAAAEISLRAERRMGEILSESLRGRGRPGKSSSTEQLKLSDLGIERKESARAQKLAALAMAEFEGRIASIKERTEKLTRASVLESSAAPVDGDEYGTPVGYLKLARKVMGGIDLDPASNVRSQCIVQAERWFSKEEDGLAQRWRGRTWLNPPYSRGLIDRFVEKLLTERPSRAVVLVNASTDTAWFNALAGAAGLFCLVRGRIGFLDEENKVRDQNRYGQAFFFFGCEAGKVKRNFADVGLIVRQA